jgi:hypothetical protein
MRKTLANLCRLLAKAPATPLQRDSVPPPDIVASVPAQA